MNEKRLQEVLAIEGQAQALYKTAVDEAERLLIQAEKDALALVDKARSQAEEEASRLVAHAWSEEETAHILSQAEEDEKATQVLAMNNFDRAVSYVLNRVAGKE